MSPVAKVTDAGLVATLHLPRGDSRHPAVIVLSGSEGGVVNANVFGQPLAAAGFVTIPSIRAVIASVPSHVVWQGNHPDQSLKSYHRPHWMQSGTPVLQLGGTSEGNRLARIDAWPRTLRFLKEHLAA